MSAPADIAASRVPLFLGELGKLTAFLRRDFLIAWSYRVAFLGDAVALLVEAVTFYFVGLLVDPQELPRFGGDETTYIEFVAIGIALGTFVQLGLQRVALAMRNEQLVGTLESLLMTPTAIATVQLGLVMYDLVYVPIRTAIFLAVIALGFGVDFQASGIAPAAVILLLFIPFIWGLGIMSAASMLTFRVAGQLVGYGAVGLTLVSGAYFPLELFPDWATSVAELNPIAIAMEGMRETLLGGAGWSGITTEILVLVPVSVASLVLGMLAFRLAVRRERRHGTLGLY
jgi:ABC-2 type transport system permease protein